LPGQAAWEALLPAQRELSWGREERVEFGLESCLGRAARVLAVAR